MAPFYGLIKFLCGPINFREEGVNPARNLPIIPVLASKPLVLYPPEMRQGDLRMVKN